MSELGEGKDNKIKYKGEYVSGKGVDTGQRFAHRSNVDKSGVQKVVDKFKTDAEKENRTVSEQYTSMADVENRARAFARGGKK